MNSSVSESTQNKKKKNIIIWAIDPIQKPSAAKNIVKELNTWATYINCDIQPVTIISKSFLNLPLDLGFLQKQRFIEATNESVNRYLKSTQLKNYLQPEVIFVPWLSTRKMASTLAKYAKKQKSQLIFTHTRSKKTKNPFRFGGFAETLVSNTQVPVLLLNPLSVPSTRIDSILFPTNFDRISKNVLVKMLPWIKAFNANIIIYNQVEIPNIYPAELTDSWHSLTLNIEPIIKSTIINRTKQAKLWIALLEKEKIPCSYIITRQKNDIGTDIIETAARNKVNLIAMSSTSGQIIQSLIGSIAKDVLLQANCPVLIFHRNS